jgi:hypothetical protein
VKGGGNRTAHRMAQTKTRTGSHHGGRTRPARARNSWCVGQRARRWTVLWMPSRRTMPILLRLTRSTARQSNVTPTKTPSGRERLAGASPDSEESGRRAFRWRTSVLLAVLLPRHSGQQGACLVLRLLPRVKAALFSLNPPQRRTIHVRPGSRAKERREKAIGQRLL